MLRRLARCIGEYRKDAILAPAYVILEVVMDVAIPLLMARIIDIGIAGENLGYIGRVGIALVIATMMALFFGFMSGKHAAKASAGFAKNVRRDLYRNIQDFSFSNIDKYSTSGLVTRLTTDVTNVQNACQMMLRIMIRSPVMLVFSLIMAFGVNPRLSLVFLGVIPVLGIGLFFMITRAYPVFERVFRTYDRMNNVVQENLRGIRVVKSYVREDHERGKFEEVSSDIFQSFSKAERILAFNMPLMQFAMYACMLLISWFGAQMIVSATMTTGQLTSLFAYAGQILMSLMMLSMVFVMLTISKASAERIVEVLEERSDMEAAKEPADKVADGSICFRNVDFGYTGDKEKLCLRGADLQIKSGETVGIIGGTGSAKSTLVQLIPRLYDVTSGAVAVGGRDVRDYDLEILRDAVAMVLQKNVLFSGSIKENLRWGNKNASDEELVRVCKLAQADSFIQSFPDGYDTYIEQGGSNLSGGQRQRLCIARALLKKPKILILDDSTSAVDTNTDARIRKVLKEEIPATTKIIIAQRVSSVEDADKIIVMDGGRINAAGTHEELLATNKIYQEVYSSQVKGGDDHGAA